MSITFPSPLLPAPPYSFLCCWQSHMVTSRLPYGPLPQALPGPEGAVQGLRLCAGYRTRGTRRIPPLPSGYHWCLCSCKMPQCSAPPLPRADCPGTGANQTGHQGHSGKAHSFLVASPSTLGDQIYLIVKGLAGLVARISKGWAPLCALVPLLVLGPRVAELRRPLHSFSSAFYVDVFERGKKKKNFLFFPFL